MLYIDGTTLDTYGRHSEYPVFLTLANIPNWHWNLPDAKVFVCFLSQLSIRDGKLRESKKFKQYKRNLEQRALKYLLNPLLQKEGIYLAINGKVEHFISHMSTILADMLETQRDQLNNMHVHVNSIILQTHKNMSAVVLSHDAAKYSIHEHENFFWKFRMMNIYDVVALDRMHLQEIGLFPYMLDFTREMIMYQSGNQIITKMDVQLATITPFSGLRILRNGYQQGAKFTGAEMRDVMKIIIFLLDELYTNNDIIRHQNDTENTSHEFVNCKKLIQCFIKFVKMYITSRKEKFNEDELNEFEVIL
ncbi:unnamed protein product [Rhizophagus irregularis]|nr:unnamed protein product [Rhizophagus irregularis]